MGPRGRKRRLFAVGGLIAFAALIQGCSACDVIDNHDLSARGESVSVSSTHYRTDVGDPVEFIASWSFERKFPDAQPKGLFDLDNDGLFETEGQIGGRTHAVSRTYTSEQTVFVTHLLEARGCNFFCFNDRSVRGATIVVDDPETEGNLAPAANFFITPNPARADQTTSFFSSSTDPDGAVVRHQWDFDGDSVYDTDLGADRSTTWVYDEPGEYEITLRVTDDKGATGVASRTLTVLDYHDIREVSGRLATAAAINPETLAFEVTGRPRSTGALTLNGGELLEIGGTARGRFPADQLPGFLQRRNLKVRWAARYYSSMDIASESTNAFGTILFDYPAGGMSCLGFETEAPAGEEPTGFFRVIGGAGKAATIRGQGAGTAAIDEGGVSFSGAGGLRVAKQPFERLGKNGCPGLRDELRRRPENSRAG